MLVTYEPEGKPDERQTWEFDPAKVRASRAEMIEHRFGKTFDEWHNAVRVGSARARRVLLWHLISLQHHTLRFEDTPDFTMGELRVEHSVAELLALVDRVKKSKMSEGEAEQLLTALDIEISNAMAREELQDLPEEAPKAPSPRNARRTGSTSRTTSESDRDSSTS